VRLPGLPLVGSAPDAIGYEPAYQVNLDGLYGAYCTDVISGGQSRFPGLENI